MRGPELRRALRTVTIAWMFGVVWLVSASGSHLRIFAGMVGFGDTAFGIMGAMPFVATFGQLIASVLVERSGLVKYQFMHFASLHRLLWLVVAGVPLFFVLPSLTAVTIMIAVVGLSHFLNALAAPAWWTWMGNLIPRRVRGKYFATRERVAMGTQIVVVIGLGALMDAIYDSSAGGIQPVALWTVSIILAVGAISGTVDILLFRGIREVIRTGRDEPKKPANGPAVPREGLIRGFLIEPMKDRTFRHFVLYGATMTFSATISGWYFWLNAMDNLRFGSLGTNCLFLVIGPLTGIWAAPHLGKAVDRWGRQPVLIVCAFGALLSLLPWFFVSRTMTAPAWLLNGAQSVLSTVGGWFGNPNWASVPHDAPLGAYLVAASACVIGGASWTGINLAQVGVILGFSEGSGRSKYIAASQILISTGGALGGFAGAAVTGSLSWLNDAPIIIGPFLYNQWHVTFAISIVTRIAAMAWLRGMADPGSAKVRDMTRFVRANVYNAVSSRLFYPLRIFGWRRSEEKK